MRVGVVADLIRANGAGVMARTAADVLIGAGHQVALLAGALDTNLERQTNDRLLGAVSFTNDQSTLANSVNAAEHAMFLRSFRRWFDAQVRHFELDALYIHNCGRVFDQRDLAELSHQLPVMHTMHDEWFYTDAHYTFATPTGEVVRTYEPRHGEELIPHDYEALFDLPEQMGTFLGIGPSGWLTNRARRVFPTLDFEHIVNSVDGDQFSLQDRNEARAALGLPEDWPIVMFVGNPTQVRKGFDVVEAACRAVRASTGIDPVRLVVGGNGSVATGGLESELGDGPLLDRVKRPTSNPLRDLGIEGPAIVVSDVDHPLMATLYGAANVLVHPSRIDNLPTVPIEAGLSGTRCLASDVGGTSETIADSDDLFPADIAIEDLGGRVSTALEESWSETTDDRMARRVAQVDRFSIETHRSEIVAALEQLCSQGVADD